MKIEGFRFIFILFVFVISSCQQQPSSLTTKHYFIFGTIIEVLIWDNDEGLVNKALYDVETELNGMHSQWHAWKKGRLTKINNAIRSQKSFELTDEEAEFIQTTQKLSQQSLGFFNPAIGELINLWGFHTDNYPITDPPPNDELIQAYLKQLPTMDDIRVDDKHISSNNSHLWLDFGGVAKGYAIDKAINIIKSYGLENAIVNAGGDLRSIGNKGNKEWRVAIRKPNSEEVLAMIDVQGDESIFTSGNYERYKEFDGKRYAHIIDPTSGYGVEQIISATVIAENGTKADAAATALIVAGKQHWESVAESMKINQVLLIDVDGNCIASNNIKLRLKNLKIKCKSF